MADTIKGFNIGGVTKLIDWNGGITNKPTIPTKVSDLTDGDNYSTKSEVSALTSSIYNDAIASSSAYTDAQISALNLSNTYAAKGVVDTLVGSDTGKSVREISSEEVAKIVASADTKYDTLKEIADWITNDTTGAAKMANDIADLQKSAHTHSNMTVLNGITSDKVNAWDGKQNALSDTDGGYGQRIKAIEDELAAAINFEAQKY